MKDSIEYSFRHSKADTSLVNKLILLGNKTNNQIYIAEGNFYKAVYYFNIDKVSSYKYYYRAEKIYKTEEDKYSYEIGKIKQKRANLLYKTDDYSKSEILTTEALIYLNKTSNNKLKARCYNQLGLISNILYQKTEMENAFDKALYYSEKLDDNSLFKYTLLNNYGIGYLYSGDYVKAYEIFKRIDLAAVKKNNIKYYGNSLSNLNYSKLLLKDTVNVVAAFNEAQAIFDSIKYYPGQILLKRYFSEYHLFNNDTISAKKSLNEGYYLAQKTNNIKEQKNVLEKLLPLHPKKHNQLFSEYKQMRDSVQVERRKLRSAFARIELETDEYIKENKTLNIYLIWALASALIIFLLFTVYWLYSKYNRKMQEEKYNNELYSLMYSKQNELRDVRNKEREHIAGMLHNRIQGRLHAYKMRLFELLNENKNDEALGSIKEIKSIAEDVRKLSHDIDSPIIDNNFASIVSDRINKMLPPQINRHLEFDEEEYDNIPVHIQAYILQSIEEALTNIIKHSKANNIVVELLVNDSDFQISVSDFGENTNSKYELGYGLKKIRKKTIALKGEFDIFANRHKGTTLLIKLPKSVISD